MLNLDLLESHAASCVLFLLEPAAGSTDRKKCRDDAIEGDMVICLALSTMWHFRDIGALAYCVMVIVGAATEVTVKVRTALELFNVSDSCF